MDLRAVVTDDKGSEHRCYACRPFGESSMILLGKTQRSYLPYKIYTLDLRTGISAGINSYSTLEDALRSFMYRI